jgi:hypothetical protein
MIRNNGTIHRHQTRRYDQKHYIVTGLFRERDFAFTIDAASPVGAEFKAIQLLSKGCACRFEEVSDFVYGNNCINVDEKIKDLTTF